MRVPPNPRIESEADKVLHLTRCRRIPVPVDAVAFRLGLGTEPAALGQGVSAVLVVQGSAGVIGYNQDDSPMRQRFSVAHEIGHFVLHQSEEKLFIDKGYTAVYRRDQLSSSGEHLREIQANQFAAALLMPSELVFQSVDGLEFDLGDEAALISLAERFQVSCQAMSVRLANLGLFSADKDEHPSL